MVAVPVCVLSPCGDVKKPLKALLFDSWYEKYRGTVCSLAVIDGNIRKGKSDG